MEARRRFTAEFKAKVALEAIRGERTISEPAMPALDLRRQDPDEVYATAEMMEQLAA